VYVGPSGTFHIVNGTIYGSNESDTTLRNSASNGAALYNEGTAEYGNGTPLTTTESTIRAVNGAPQP